MNAAPVPVVLVHASRTSPSMWRTQVDALERLGARVAVPTLPGHGVREDEPFTLDGAVETVRAAVDDVGGRALVVGLSVGGYVGIEHRARHPEQSAGLMAVSCSTDPRTPLRAGWEVLARWIESWPDSGAALNSAVVRATVPADGLPHLEGDGFALRVMSQIVEEMARVRPLDSLDAATSPVWIVNGTWDHFRTGERAYLRAARASGAHVRLVHVREAKHLVNLDRPVAFNRVLLEAWSDAVATP
ncbi:alpha/beta fold hydrolase [Paraoerskovia marina]|uniref:alpha/beta fold hydrolase n=1 Tax=Paraoerskovia marina TaxID=545619 RepID=UPI000492721A|nr:alpha/beta hydrolase [Paraoerskovia marina]